MTDDIERLVDEKYRGHLIDFGTIDVEEAESISISLCRYREGLIEAYRLLREFPKTDPNIEGAHARIFVWAETVGEWNDKRRRFLGEVE